MIIPSMLMPDGTVRPGLAFMHTKPQNQWTEDEVKQVIELQREVQEMYSRRDNITFVDITDAAANQLKE